MSGTDYRPSDVADGIAATLAAGDNAFTEVGETFHGVTRSVFTVDLDSGQRFKVTVEHASD